MCGGLWVGREDERLLKGKFRGYPHLNLKKIEEARHFVFTEFKRNIL